MREDIVHDIYEEIPKSITDLEDLPIYHILIIVGAYIAIGIGLFHFILTLPGNPYPILVFHFLIDIFFGFGLILSYINIVDKMRIWSILTVIFSLILIAFGGIVGILAGVISLFGGAIAFFNYLGEDIGI